MEALFVSPHLIDIILVFTVVEAVLLFVWLRRRASGSGPRYLPEGQDLDEDRDRAVVERPGVILPIGLMLLPGIFLMAAIRAALAGMAWPWVPAALAGALAAHLLDLRSRWRG